jgi:hypothetical protein
MVMPGLRLRLSAQEGLPRALAARAYERRQAQMNYLWIIPAVMAACWWLFNMAGWLWCTITRAPSDAPMPFSYRIWTMGPRYVDYCWDRRP